MALTKIGTDGFKDDAVTTDKLANAINTERTANTAKTSTTINNNADNRVITGSGTANTLEGEANLTYNGTKLNLAGSNEADLLQLGTGNSAGNTFASIRGDNEAGIRIRGGGSERGGEIELGGGTRDTDPAVIKFSTNTSNSFQERMRIDSSGRVLINTSSALATEGFLQVACNSNTDGVQFHCTDTSNTNILEMKHANATGSDTGAMIAFRRADGTMVGSIVSNGSSTAYNTSSDYRLKENVTAISDGITRLKTLKPSKFNFKVDKDTTVDGFLAHEVSSIVPEAITGTKDGTQDILYTVEDTIPSGKKVGDVKETVPKYQGIDQSKLVPLLTAALQEAVAKIEVLETKVAALEAT